MAEQHDYYQILGVDRSASGQEIKSTFLKLATEFQAAGKPRKIEAVESFRLLARAYRVLIDPEQRRRYDHLGEAGVVDQPLSTGYDLEQLEEWLWKMSLPETGIT